MLGKCDSVLCVKKPCWASHEPHTNIFMWINKILEGNSSKTNSHCIPDTWTRVFTFHNHHNQIARWNHNACTRHHPKGNRRSHRKKLIHMLWCRERAQIGTNGRLQVSGGKWESSDISSLSLSAVRYPLTGNSFPSQLLEMQQSCL